MRGGEFLTSDLLAKLWREFGALVISESAITGFSEWLKSKNSLWHTVGRVTFHLAENKRDPNRPFAFLATYTHRLSEQGKPQHLPLARALQEYAGSKNKTALTSLLAPVQRAAEKSDLARGLVETPSAIPADGLDTGGRTSVFARHSGVRRERSGGAGAGLVERWSTRSSAGQCADRRETGQLPRLG